MADEELPPQPPPPPPVLAQYTRGVLLGQGVTAAGGGGVYREQDNATREEVAIKYMKLGAMTPGPLRGSSLSCETHMARLTSAGSFASAARCTCPAGAWRS